MKGKFTCLLFFKCENFGYNIGPTPLNVALDLIFHLKNGLLGGKSIWGRIGLPNVGRAKVFMLWLVLRTKDRMLRGT